MIKRVDLELFYQFLTVLASGQKTGITMLQRKTGTNHSRCAKYLSLMEKLGLVRMEIHEKNKNVQITEAGKTARLVLSSCFE